MKSNQGPGIHFDLIIKYVQMTTCSPLGTFWWSMFTHTACPQGSHSYYGTTACCLSTPLFILLCSTPDVDLRGDWLVRLDLETSWSSTAVCISSEHELTNWSDIMYLKCGSRADSQVESWGLHSLHSPGVVRNPAVSCIDVSSIQNSFPGSVPVWRPMMFSGEFN